jgi:GTP-binding protein
MSQFVDECGLHVKAGDGGAGCVSFRREAHVDRGGPDGGDGGDGGDIWLVSDHNVASLIGFRDFPFRRATDGVHGMGRKRHGRRGESTDVAVPEGTIVRDGDGTVLADLAAVGERYLIAEGGLGGKGNARFLSNRRRAPAFGEQGEVGEERWLKLELKLNADVAIIGFPNVGKSTLISSISAAKPKIADYPFTTLQPNLGVLRLDDGFEIVVADIPGLIEGAADGKGLGHRFLRHIERARVLLVLLDLAPYDQTPPQAQLDVLLRELGEYQPDLLDRPRLVVGSKCDVAQFDSEEMVVSAVTHVGIDKMVGKLAELVRQDRTEAVIETQPVIHRPLGDGFEVLATGERKWEIEGRTALRAVRVTDISNPEALDYVQERLKSLGIDRALSQAGVRAGDLVRIGDLEFEYEDEL